MVVSSTAILLLESGVLSLLRLCFKDETMERVQLEDSTNGSVAYAITAIDGVDVHVTQAVIQDTKSSTKQLRFVRVNIDEARVAFEGAERVEEARRSYHFSKDGRFIYGLATRTQAEAFNVFDITEKSWSACKLTGTLRNVSCL